MIIIDDVISKVEDYGVSSGLLSSDERELIVEALIYYKEIYN